MAVEVGVPTANFAGPYSLAFSLEDFPHKPQILKSLLGRFFTAAMSRLDLPIVGYLLLIGDLWFDFSSFGSP